MVWLPSVTIYVHAKNYVKLKGVPGENDSQKVKYVFDNFVWPKEELK